MVSYQIPIDDHRVVSHRVVSIAPNPDGSSTIQTRGDANAANDPWTARITADRIGQVRGVVPKAGTVIRVLRQPELSRALRFGAPVFFVLLAPGRRLAAAEVMNFLRTRTRPRALICALEAVVVVLLMPLPAEAASAARPSPARSRPPAAPWPRRPPPRTPRTASFSLSAARSTPPAGRSRRPSTPPATAWW
jgi:hypothetical protein